MQHPEGTKTIDITQLGASRRRLLHIDPAGHTWETEEDFEASEDPVYRQFGEEDDL